MVVCVAKQCCLASISAPINKLWKEYTVKVVQERSLDLIHGPNYLEFNLICMGVRNGFKWLVENMIERKNKPQQPAKKLILLL